MDLENEPYPEVAPWPSHIEAIHRLKQNPVARCLRVRFKAMHDFLLVFKNHHPIVYFANLWMDQHCPLMLALERGESPDPDSVEFSPIEQKPFFPELPRECMANFPQLWTQKSAICLKAWPILKLLWKAAPRKSHSADVGNMVKTLLCEPKHAHKYCNVILSIHQASMLGNYRHCKEHPPLPLRFAIYRMGLDTIIEQSTAKHPFFLYCLKEALVSYIRNDFAVKYLLSRFSNEWKVFETKVIECCDRILRPYAAVSSSISARLLMTHGKGATLNPSSMATQTKKLTTICKEYAKENEITSPPPSRTIQALTHDEWLLCRSDAQSEKHFTAERLGSPAQQFHSISLPIEHYRRQLKALKGEEFIKPNLHVCSTCKGGYFIGYNTGGKKTEALGDVITNRWYCPKCENEPELEKIELLGQIVFCQNGVYSCCEKCARPTMYFQEGTFCVECAKKQEKDEADLNLVDSVGVKRTCWYPRCSRNCTDAFRIVPRDGLEAGDTWPLFATCPIHQLPPHCIADPIPEEIVKKTWWNNSRGASQ